MFVETRLCASKKNISIKNYPVQLFATFREKKQIEHVMEFRRNIGRIEHKYDCDLYKNKLGLKKLAFKTYKYNLKFEMVADRFLEVARTNVMAPELGAAV